jgi:hypothetical protein
VLIFLSIPLLCIINPISFILIHIIVSKKIITLN